MVTLLWTKHGTQRRKFVMIFIDIFSARTKCLKMSAEDSIEFLDLHPRIIGALRNGMDLPFILRTLQN